MSLGECLGETRRGPRWCYGRPFIYLSAYARCAWECKPGPGSRRGPLESLSYLPTLHTHARDPYLHPREVFLHSRYPTFLPYTAVLPSRSLTNTPWSYQSRVTATSEPATDTAGFQLGSDISPNFTTAVQVSALQYWIIPVRLSLSSLNKNCSSFL